MQDLAWAEAYGYGAERTDQLEGWLCNYDLIVNTVPALVLGEAELEDLSPDCLVIDLASRARWGGLRVRSACWASRPSGPCPCPARWPR